MHLLCHMLLMEGGYCVRRFFHPVFPVCREGTFQRVTDIDGSWRSQFGVPCHQKHILLWAIPLTLTFSHRKRELFAN